MNLNKDNVDKYMEEIIKMHKNIERYIWAEGGSRRGTPHYNFNNTCNSLLCLFKEVIDGLYIIKEAHISRDLSLDLLKYKYYDDNKISHPAISRKIEFDYDSMYSYISNTTAQIRDIMLKLWETESPPSLDLTQAVHLIMNLYFRERENTNSRKRRIYNHENDNYIDVDM